LNANWKFFLCQPKSQNRQNSDSINDKCIPGKLLNQLARLLKVLLSSFSQLPTSAHCFAMKMHSSIKLQPRKSHENHNKLSIGAESNKEAN
jgi:hypothetical protein